MVCWVEMMMTMQMVGLEVMTALELKEPILCWTWFLTHILSAKSL